ncbi:MAG: NhaA family Na+:H+ antiporter, partial [Candidatus Azotimanducaceae bacterium]
GFVLWFILMKLGLHGTLAGVIVALAAPVRPAIARFAFTDRLKKTAGQFEDEHNDATNSIFEQPKQNAIAHEVIDAAKQATAPLSRWEQHLETPISFVVMPLFAFMNAGILLNQKAAESAWNSELSAAIFFALLFGKPIGILLGVWLGRLVGFVEIPDGLTLRHIFGIGLLGGIGFTMSLFIATLSFGEGSGLLDIAKQSVIFSSLAAGILGYLWLRLFCKKPTSS